MPIYRSSEGTALSTFLRAPAGSRGYFPLDTEKDAQRVFANLRESCRYNGGKIYRRVVYLADPDTLSLKIMVEVEVIKSAGKRKKKPKRAKPQVEEKKKIVRTKRYILDQFKHDVQVADLIDKALIPFRTAKKTGVTTLDLLLSDHALEQEYRQMEKREIYEEEVRRKAVASSNDITEEPK